MLCPSTYQENPLPSLMSISFNLAFLSSNAELKKLDFCISDRVPVEDGLLIMPRPRINRNFMGYNYNPNRNRAFCGSKMPI